ncbi:MAG: hypothetical protein ACQCXQ_01080 [Verrucomicrobiales bacterium]|nr:hypothetical protein [Verrucomicrobiota bacterium JB025]
MKTIIRCALVSVPMALALPAQTIAPSNRFAWAANLGWTDWTGGGFDGVSTGEYVCSGWIWLPNCGWLSTGDGTPADGVSYSNTSASDFGVNTTGFQLEDSEVFAKLSGYAYGANIGWVAFETTGNPRISLTTGEISGAVWSANCGWIDLDDAVWNLASQAIVPGEDDDSDGIADAYELENAGNLTLLTNEGDYDRDGVSDVDEYLSGTLATDPASRFAITAISISESMVEMSWTSSLRRQYRISSSPDLDPATWNPSLDRIVPDGGLTTREFAGPGDLLHFYRVEALHPLSP